jgi:hypothetical protein
MSKTSRSRAARPAKRPAIDPAAPGVVLAYLGGRPGRFTPARDLEGADVARIAYHRASIAIQRSRSALVRPGETRPAPRRADPPGPEAIAAVADELVASGSFAWAAAPPEPAPSTIPEPDAPAAPEA